MSFLEKVYERALLRELRICGLAAEAQVPIEVRYKGVVVGEYLDDVIVEGAVVIELKAQQVASKEWDAQLLNYLKATGARVGMLVNFCYPKMTIRRFIV